MKAVSNHGNPHLLILAQVDEGVNQINASYIDDSNYTGYGNG